MQNKSAKSILSLSLLVVCLFKPGMVNDCYAISPESILYQNTPAVKLLLFEAHPMQKSIIVRWATAFETKIAGYELQRSTKLPDFKTITTIAPTGTLGSAATYHFEDANVLFNQNYYYRIKMIDSSGVITFSKTTMAALDDKRGLFEATNKPFQTTSEISYELLQESDVLLEVYDFMGRYQYTILKKLQPKGYYKSYFSASEKGLPPGMYCIRMTQGKATYNKMVYVYN